MDYEVALTLPELGPVRLSSSDHIAAEVRFAAALERACADTGGVVETYRLAEANLDAWADGEHAPDAPEPDTPWKAALRAAEAHTWAAIRRPPGAIFDVRVVSPAEDFRVFEYSSQDVPF